MSDGCERDTALLSSRRPPIEVVGLGQACVDFLGKVHQYPEEDTKAELIDLEIQCGGPASTAMVTLARLGTRAAFMGSVGEDGFGKRRTPPVLETCFTAPTSTACSGAGTRPDACALPLRQRP